MVANLTTDRYKAAKPIICAYNQEKDRKENNDEVGTNIIAKDSLENMEPDSGSEINKKGYVAVDSETQSSKNNSW